MTDLPPRRTRQRTAAPLTNEEVRALGVQLARLRNDGETAVVVRIGAHGPSDSMPEGHVSATVFDGKITGTADAKYLDDAISLARGHLKREQAAQAKKGQGK